MTQIIDKKTDYATAGKRTRRQDGYDKLVGRTRYAGDLLSLVYYMQGWFSALMHTHV